MATATAPPPRRPTAALSTFALVLSFVCGGCSWASNYGPLVSLALAIAAWLLAWKRPDRFAGTGRALLAILLSVMFTWFALTMRPYVGSRGDLRYGRVMDRLDEMNRPMRPANALRALQSAQTQYADLNGGFYDTPECLVAVPRCIPGASAVNPEIREWPPAADAPFFTYTFHPGRLPTAKEKEKAGRAVSPSSLVTFAVTVTPRAPGLPAFCTDSTSSIRIHRDGRAPRLVEGLCDPEIPVLQ